MLWFIRQPFLPRQAPRYAVDRETDFWSIQLVTPVHGESQHPGPNGPVDLDLDITLHHLLVHFAALAAVPTNNQHGQ